MYRIAFVLPVCLALGCPPASEEPADKADDSPDDVVPACLDDEVAGVLESHVEQIAGSLTLIGGHASAWEAVIMFNVPNWVVTAAAWVFFVEECVGEAEFDAWCSDGVCWQMACDATPGSWSQQGWLEAASTREGWSYAGAETTVSWPGEGDVLDVALSMEATDGDGRDWSFDGTVAYDEQSWTIRETFPALSGDGAVVLDVSFDGASHAVAGGVTIAGEAVRTAVDGGDSFVLEPAGDCGAR